MSSVDYCCEDRTNEGKGTESDGDGRMSFHRKKKFYHRK